MGRDVLFLGSSYLFFYLFALFLVHAIPVDASLLNPVVSVEHNMYTSLCSGTFDVTKYQDGSIDVSATGALKAEYEKTGFSSITVSSSTVSF